jgi:hypothetical protein
MVTHSIAQQSFPKLSTYTLIYEVLSVAAVSTFQGLASFEYFFLFCSHSVFGLAHAKAPDQSWKGRGSL